MPTGLRHPRRTLISLILFAALTLAALQNVTVDDAVLVGTVVPEYLPSGSNWNIGQDCTGCLVQPDPTKAYNGTWHDVTYSPGNGFAPTITFSFTGSAVYIYFILANNVPYATTLTNVTFLLDGASAGTFVHQPSASTDYQYNVAVYSNNALPFGLHTMVVEPADTTTNGSNVLILFDYFVYTTNTTASNTSSSAPPPTSSPSQTSVANGTSSSPNTSAIVGGVVAGVAGLVFIIAFLWYWRYKRRSRHLSPSADEEIDAFPPPPPVTMMSYTDTPSLAQEIINPFVELEPKRRIDAPSSIGKSSTPSAITSSSGSGPSSSAVHGLLEQMEQLRDEVTQLRQERDDNRNMYQLVSSPPPEYSEYTDDRQR